MKVKMLVSISGPNWRAHKDREIDVTAEEGKNLIKAGYAVAIAKRDIDKAEKVLEEISFSAPDISPAKISIDAKLVRDRLEDILKDEDLKRYIL